MERWKLAAKLAAALAQNKLIAYKQKKTFITCCEELPDFFLKPPKSSQEVNKINFQVAPCGVEIIAPNKQKSKQRVLLRDLLCLKWKII